MILGQHGEPPVGLGAGVGDQAIGDLRLQHEVHVAQLRAVFEQQRHQRAGDVVRQVSNHPPATPRRRQHVVPAHAQRIGLARARRRQTAPQRGRQVAIDLNGDDGGRFGNQSFGQRSGAGADFHHVIGGAQSQGRDDALDGRRVGKEMLTEAFARAGGDRSIGVSRRCRFRHPRSRRRC